MTTPNSPCTSPMGRLLHSYIAELLDDADSESVERHLEDCSHCKRDYLTVLRVRHAAGVKHASMMDVSSQNGSAIATPAQSAAAAFAAAAVQRKGKASDGS